ncbi:MAG: NHLP bacteriocin system secretion protein [Magnetococcales bacterium]|nr:NHLP bacteriocin system secretion protein [Magnetococcales bacterium]
MAKEIFRKTALERLASPEQLDLTVQVTTPKGWLALIGLIGIIVMACIWSFVGSIPTKVMGKGLLIKSGGVADVVALSTGQVATLYVETGDVVRTGQTVARIDQPELLDQINKERGKLEDLEERRKEILDLGVTNVQLQDESMKEQRNLLTSKIKSSQEKVAFIKEKLANQTKLFDQGLITKNTLLATKQELVTAEEEIKSSSSQLSQLSVNKQSVTEQKRTELFNIENQIGESERQIKILLEKLDLSSKVVSPFAGRVLEVMVGSGDFTSPGKALMSLEQTGNAIKNLEAVIYLSPADGKRVFPGMKVQIAPSTVKQEEYGFMLGIVTAVADFPSTKEGMQRLLKNEKLVEMFTKDNAPVAIYADLIPDSRTVSGYKWSSPIGPPVEIYTGTMCDSTITVREQPPITLVMPFLKRLFGVI